ncbi:hypothetical protein V8C35DRAFT_289231 [Trichoderma chlorosporum]
MHRSPEDIVATWLVNRAGYCHGVLWEERRYLDRQHTKLSCPTDGGFFTVVEPSEISGVGPSRMTLRLAPIKLAAAREDFVFSQGFYSSLFLHKRLRIGWGLVNELVDIYRQPASPMYDVHAHILLAVRIWSAGIGEFALNGRSEDCIISLPGRLQLAVQLLSWRDTTICQPKRRHGMTDTHHSESGKSRNCASFIAAYLPSCTSAYIFDHCC